MKKIVIFGAGRIGRSFIGQIFSRGGFEVVFVDISKNLVHLLNEHQSYKVIIKGDQEEILTINNVRGILFNDSDKIINEILSADLVAVSVGQAAIHEVIPYIAKCLEIKYNASRRRPVDIILAENMRNAAGYFSDEIKCLLGKDFPVDEMAGLIETSIGKMVPFMTYDDLKQDPLQIFAEPYNTLILDKKGFRNPVPGLPWLAPKDNIKAWVDRKSFIHNLGHVTAAYNGFIMHPGVVYLYEMLENTGLHEIVRRTMLQSARILIEMYPGEFNFKELEEHVDDLLKRFMNKALKDTVFRVGCDLARKLGPDDRLVAPITEALCLGLPYDKILYSLVCGFYFRAKDESGIYYHADEEFYNTFKPDIKYLLVKFCNFDPVKNKHLFIEARNICREINKRYRPEIIIH